MKITIIGASAGIGLATVRQALKKGYQVTALSRDTSSMPEHPLLTKINGTATSVPDLKKAMQGSEATIVTIGTKDKKRTTLFTETAIALIQAISEVNSEIPVLVVTGFGAGESSKYLNFFMRTIIRLFLKDQYENKTRMEELLTGSQLKWEIVRPGMLTNEAQSGNYKALPELSKRLKVSRISREDVAHFLVEQAENPTFLHRYVTLTGYK